VKPTLPDIPQQTSFALEVEPINANGVPGSSPPIAIGRQRSRRASTSYPPATGRLLRRREVALLTGLSRSSLYRLMATGDFPGPVHISSNAVAWPESEVHDWIANCLVGRDAKRASSKRRKQP
jgi:prophage regulatory protein